jgi:hypothetical protein
MSKELIVLMITYYTFSAIVAEIHLKQADGNPVFWYVGGAALAVGSSLIGFFGIIPMVLFWVLHKRLS